MILVELYSKEDCRLCEVVKELLLKVQHTQPFEFRQISIHEGDEFFENFKEKIPLIYINRELAFQYRVSEREFRKKLSSAEQPG